MIKQKPANTENKVPLGIVVDPEVLTAINQQRGREKKSTFCNYHLRRSLGLEGSESAEA